MFFVAAKTIGFFAVPSNLLVISCLGGALLTLTRLKKVGMRLTLASALLLLLCGFFPVGRAMLLPLEQRFPPWRISDGEPSGVVVLGGVVDAEISSERGVEELTASAD